MNKYASQIVFLPTSTILSTAYALKVRLPNEIKAGS